MASNEILKTLKKIDRNPTHNLSLLFLLLLHSNRLGQVSRLVDITSPAHSHIIGKEL